MPPRVGRREQRAGAEAATAVCASEAVTEVAAVAVMAAEVAVAELLAVVSLDSTTVVRW
jgi:hypothetical protein